MMVLLAIFIYLIRMLMIGVATGIAFIKLNLFHRMKDWEIVILGVCVAPIFASLMNYLLGLTFIGWSSVVFYIVPLVLAGVWIVYEKNYEILFSVLQVGTVYAKEQKALLGKWIVIDGVLAFGMWTGLAACFYAKFSMIKLFIKETVFNPNSLTHIMANIVFVIVVMAALFSFYRLKKRKFKVDKRLLQTHFFFLCVFAVLSSIIFSGVVYNIIPLNYYSEDLSHYELEARYFVEDKNSWGIDNYTDERNGSSFRDDHGPLWITEIADPWITSDLIHISDGLRVSNFNLFYLYVCCNVLIFFMGRCVENNNLTGIISIMLFDFYLKEKFFLMQISRDAFKYICLFLLLLYIKNVIFEIAERHIGWKYYGALALFSGVAVNGHEGNVYIMFGVFLIALCILIKYQVALKRILLSAISAFMGSLIGIYKTISLYFTTGRLHTTTLEAFYGTPVVDQLQKHWWHRGEWSQILLDYTPPVMAMIGLGLMGLLFMIIIGRKRKDLWIAGLLFLGALLPLTGCLDWIGYKYSVWVFEQPRYRMSFLIFLAITGSWFLNTTWRQKYMKCFCTCSLVVVLFSWWYIEAQKYMQYNINYIKQCQLDAEIYKNMATKITAIVNGNVFMAQQPMLYYFPGTPKLLYHVYAKPLMQAKNFDEVKAAITMLKVGCVILPTGGEFAIDYTLLPFWTYINDEFICFSSTQFGKYDIFLNPELIKGTVF